MGREGPVTVVEHPSPMAEFLGYQSAEGRPLMRSPVVPADHTLQSRGLRSHAVDAVAKGEKDVVCPAAVGNAVEEVFKERCRRSVERRGGEAVWGIGFFCGWLEPTPVPQAVGRIADEEGCKGRDNE